MAEQVTELRTRTQRLIGPTPGGLPGEGGILLDAVLDESIELSSMVTSFPIELGAEINDHVISQPIRYVMRGVVTDTPTEWAATDYSHGNGDTRSLSAWALLQALQRRGEAFEITTGFGIYPSLVIERIRARRNAQRDRALDFEADLRQIITVQTQAVTISAEQLQAGQAAAGMASAEDRGRQQKKTIPDNQQGLVAKAFDAAVGLFEDSP